MSDTQHTPGPWYTSTDVHHDDEYAVKAGEAVVCTVWPMGDDQAGNDIQNANEHLISAAPCMVAALREMVRRARDTNMVGDQDHCDVALTDAVVQAEAAIAKAEGMF